MSKHISANYPGRAPNVQIKKVTKYKTGRPKMIVKGFIHTSLYKTEYDFMFRKRLRRGFVTSNGKI